MSDESNAIEQFGQLTDVLLKSLKVPDAAINYIDGAIAYEQGHAEKQNPVLTALEFGAAGLISTAVVSAIGVEALGAGVLAVAGEEAVAGAAALVDSTIAGSFPGLALAATGSEVVASVAQAVGTVAVGAPISKIVAAGFESWATDVLHPKKLDITKSDNNPIEVSQGNSAVILSNSRNVNVDSDANAFIIGNGYSASLGINSTTTQVSFGSGSKSYFENSDGSSEVLTTGSNGSEILRYYSGGAGTGNLLGRDVERANGTSALTTFDASGSPTTFVYSGPEGTGNVIGGNGGGTSSGSGSQGSSSGGTAGQGSAGTATFKYQGTPLIGGDFAGGTIDATVVIGNYNPNFSGEITSQQNDNNPFIYSATLNSGPYSDMAESASYAVTTAGKSGIGLTNGQVSSWSLDTSGSQVVMESEAVSLTPQPNNLDFINFANSTSLSTSSTTDVGTHPLTGTWSRTS